MKSNKLSVACFICGILSIVLNCFSSIISSLGYGAIFTILEVIMQIFLIILGIIAIVLFFVEKKKENGNKGYSLAGLVCGIIGGSNSITRIITLIIYTIRGALI